MEEIRFDKITFQYPEAKSPQFQDFSLTLQNGMTSFIGQNGTGKSTLLLLGAGFLLPDTGKVYVQGIDTVQLRAEHEHQAYISFIYQNMEFETEERIGDLLAFVLANGFRADKDDTLLSTLIHTFELEKILHQRTQEISKGELQRTILAFSLLYGSRILMMDEPIFAMEEPQKHRAMQFLREFAHQDNMSIFYSVHELTLSQKYSDYTLLFQRHAAPLYGPTTNIATHGNIEQAYEMPITYLKQEEFLYRDALTGSHKSGE